MGSTIRKFCVKFDPRREVELATALSKLGRVTADRSGAVFWIEGPLTELQIQETPGVDRVIEYVQPLWSDILPDDRTPLPPHMAFRKHGDESPGH